MCRCICFWAIVITKALKLSLRETALAEVFEDLCTKAVIELKGF